MNREGVFWFTFGIGCVLAYKLTIHQLESFKRQAELAPEEPRDTVDKATENALKLDTLVVLSHGVNYNLSRAAIRIIADRALADGNFPTLLQNLRSFDPSTRQQSLKILRFLILSKQKSDMAFYTNDHDHILSKDTEAKLHSPQLYSAVIRALLLSLPRRIPSPTNPSEITIIPRDTLSEHLALESLRRLIIRDRIYLILEAGFATYLKYIPPPDPTKHANIVEAFYDDDYEPEVHYLMDMHYMMVDHPSTDQGELYRAYLERVGIPLRVYEMRAWERAAARGGSISVAGGGGGGDGVGDDVGEVGGINGVVLESELGGFSAVDGSVDAAGAGVPPAEDGEDGDGGLDYRAWMDNRVDRFSSAMREVFRDGENEEQRQELFDMARRINNANHTLPLPTFPSHVNPDEEAFLEADMLRNGMLGEQVQQIGEQIVQHQQEELRRMQAQHQQSSRRQTEPGS